MTELNPQASLVPSKEVSPSGAFLPETGALGLSLDAWAKALVVGPLFIAVYWLVLRWLWDKTNPFTGEANWGHAVCIPAVGLYYLYINRDDLLKQPIQPLLFGKFTAPHRLWVATAMIAVGGLAYLLSKAGVFTDPSMFVKAGGEALAIFGLLVLLLDWGFASLLFGLALFAYGIWPGQNQFVQGCGMILTLFGVVLMLTGWRVMQFAWFPIAYLICAIPWPPLVYSYIASPLQTLAAKVAVKTLQFTGVNAWRTGTKINMDGGLNGLRTLNVAEACAGLRSLMTFITVGVAVAFLSARPLWQKIIISVSAIPIAIFCNVMRIAGQGLLDHYVPPPYGHQLAEGFAHQFVGLVMLVPAFFMILLVGWMLDHIFVEELDEEKTSAGVLAGPAAGQLVREVPRKPTVALVAKAPTTKSTEPISKPVAPVAKPAASPAPVAPVAPPVKPVAPAPAAKPVVPPVSKPTPPPTRAPGAPVIPPRPGIVPPRPGASRPASPQSRPPTPPPSNKPPQPPQEDQK